MYAIISSGKDKGKRLLPHLHKGGYYVASTSRFEKDYIKVETLEELRALVLAGYGARLKAHNSQNAASIIIPASINFDDEISSASSPKELLPKVVSDVDLDPESITTRRREQALLRAHLLKGKTHQNCVICGHTFPQDLLVAAHIKDRAKCTNQEKLDFDNIATLMCSLGCDALYGGRYIYVDDGKVISNSKKTVRAGTHIRTTVKSVEGNKVNNWESSQLYYEWHKKQCSRA
jgi:hypothetical protein